LVPINDGDYDVNVSGSVSPFERPGLGPWLQVGRLEMWDAICVSKLDRLTRSLFDFVAFTTWLEARGKTLLCLDPMVDLSTPAGRAFASITATFAQFERETIAARVRDAWHKLRDSGKYCGGQVPFGYRPVKLGRGWGYEPDLVYGPIVAEMFDRYSRYESLGSITRWLNESGIPTPWNVTRLRGKKPAKETLWKVTSVRKILASPASLGATVRTDGTAVRDADGVVVYRADKLVERDLWERVQARLAANPVAAKVNSWPLTGVAFCGVCGASMYTTTARYGGKQYRYLGCVHSIHRDGICTARRVMADELETVILDELLALIGDVDLTEDKLIPGRDISADIIRVSEQIGHLYGVIQREAIAGVDVREKQEALKQAEEELRRLMALKPVEASVEPVPTGVTFRQNWADLGAPGRNEFLRSHGVRAVVSRDELPPIEHRDGTMTPLDIQRMVSIDRPKLHVVIDLGTLGDMMRRANAMATTDH
jgi:site-specific DNA recombinase